MHTSKRLISLLAALALGSAAAAGTQAGTQVQNTATATYFDQNGQPVIDPNTGLEVGTVNKPQSSNQVTTTVDPVPSFTVTPNDGGTVGVPDPNAPIPAYDITAKPGDTVSFKYTLTNTGNVPNEGFTLGTLVDPSGAPVNPRYYPASADTNNDGVLSAAEIAASAPITSVTGVDPAAAVSFFAVYTVPTAAVNGAKYGTSPDVARSDNAGFTNDPAVANDNDNYNRVTVARADGALVGPRNDADANGTPDNATPAVAPYASPEGVTITPAGDVQSATLPGGATVITFTNTVRNTGNRADVFTLSEINQNFPAGTVITLTDTAGNPITATTSLAADPDGAGPLIGGTFDVRVKITVPAGATSATDAGGIPQQPTVTLSATSVNAGAGATPDTTRDVLNLVGVQLGDRTAPAGTVPDPVTTQTVTPTPGDPNDVVRATFPMDVYNAGNAPDKFNLAGSVTLPTTAGGTVVVPVTYYLDVNGDGLYQPGTDTPLTDTNGDGVPDTGTLTPGQEAKVLAVVVIPDNAAATSTPALVSQTATSPLTGVTASDNNEAITVLGTGVLGLKKLVDNCGNPALCPAARAFGDTVINNTARPQDTLRYTIIGKNQRNANLTATVLADTLPANTSFVSVSGSVTGQTGGQVLYQVNGGGWSASAPTSAPDGAKIEVAYDSNTSGTITSADVLAPGAELKVELQVKVK